MSLSPVLHVPNGELVTRFSYSTWPLTSLGAVDYPVQPYAFVQYKQMDFHAKTPDRIAEDGATLDQQQQHGHVVKLTPRVPAYQDQHTHQRWSEF